MCLIQLLTFYLLKKQNSISHILWLFSSHCFYVRNSLINCTRRNQLKPFSIRKTPSPPPPPPPTKNVSCNNTMKERHAMINNSEIVKKSNVSCIEMRSIFLCIYSYTPIINHAIFVSWSLRFSWVCLFV